MIAGIAGERGVEMSMFSFAAVALPVALVGAVAVYLVSPRVLRGLAETQTPAKDWRVEIPVTSPARAENRRAATLGIFKTQEYELAGIQRWGTMVDADETIEAGDVLVFAATEEGIAAIWRTPLFGMSAHRLYAVSISVGEHGTLHDFERDGSLRIIAARTANSLHEHALTPGETCFVAAENEEAVARNPAVALWQTATSRAPQPRKTAVALGILLCVIIAASFGLAPAEVAASAGAVLMVVAGVITPRAAVGALEPKVLALVVVLALATTVMTNLVTNAATASIVTPVAITIATEMHVDPVTVLALVGTCVSFTLLNPYSHQSNVMVMQPGGYTGGLFARLGAPVLVACLVAVCGVAYRPLAVARTRDPTMSSDADARRGGGGVRGHVGTGRRHGLRTSRGRRHGAQLHVGRGRRGRPRRRPRPQVTLSGGGKRRILYMNTSDPRPEVHHLALPGPGHAAADRQGHRVRARERHRRALRRRWRRRDLRARRPAAHPPLHLHR